MGKDYNAEGQHDRAEARDEDLVDLVIGGGGSRHYNPPDDPDDAAAYQEGWDNAER